MTVSSQHSMFTEASLEVAWSDDERVFQRGLSRSADGKPDCVLVVTPAAEHPTAPNIDRLAHEYELRDAMDSNWAALPLALIRERGQTMLVLADAGGEPLEALLGKPLDIETFLRLALAISTSLVGLHSRGLVHKDLKPANILVNIDGSVARFTGFGIAARLSRPDPQLDAIPTMSGTPAYMAPEQTGRMNRPVDTRSDLYALGITFYQMITGVLPFTATDTMEWVHCHTARQAPPPSDRIAGLPPILSSIIMKLIAKTPETRYQTAAGLLRDLQQCNSRWRSKRRIEPFTLAENDHPDRILIQTTLYGRERELNALLASYDRIADRSTTELTLVFGSSGVGKSALVSELENRLARRDHRFASGKHDQYNRHIPYATLAQALRSLVRLLLEKDETELGFWRDRLRDALDPVGHDIADLVPELTLIIDEQPPAPEVLPQHARRRFQAALHRFIGAFACASQPLVLFLDDLQWADLATLDLIEDMVVRYPLPHVMLIGAYRDNEAGLDHPLFHTIQAKNRAGASIGHIGLASLTVEDVQHLIEDALRSARDHVRPLAALVHAKTAGNPFFLIQFLQALAEEKLLTFDYDICRWQWDVKCIAAQGYADNVIDLMISKLSGLSGATLMAMQELVGLGMSADTPTLCLIHNTSEQQLHDDLLPAIRLNLIEPAEAGYRFVHDRVREAGYALIPEDRRPSLHLRIGRLLLSQPAAPRQNNRLFEIVGQLNRGATLITLTDERDIVSQLNFAAGKRAKASSAYATALNYFAAGSELLTNDGRPYQRSLFFSLELMRAECEFLTGDASGADERLTALSAHTNDVTDRAAIACLRIDVNTTLDRSDRAIGVGLDFLNQVGINWSSSPVDEEVSREYARVWDMLGDQNIEQLVDLPLCDNLTCLAMMDVLTKLQAPAQYLNFNLYSLITCRAVSLSLMNGNSDGSCVAYAGLGIVAGLQFDDHGAGWRFGQLGSTLVERHNLKRFEAATYQCFANHIVPWARHFRDACEELRRAFDAAVRTASFTYAAYSLVNLNGNLFEAGDPLAAIQSEANKGLEFTRGIRFGIVSDIITAQVALFRTLRGLTLKFGHLDDHDFSEQAVEARLGASPNLWRAECLYWICKLRARVFAREYTSASEILSLLKQRGWIPMTPSERLAYHFYGAISIAATATPDASNSYDLTALTAHHRELQKWAQNCPDNFESRATLVEAEIARLSGDDIKAMRLYEQSIRSAHGQGFTHIEALAYELSSSFYAKRGYDEFSRLYLRNARDTYASWGADGKVRQLEDLHDSLRDREPLTVPTSTIDATVAQLDLATVLKVSDAVSAETELETLIDTLLRMALEHAGAERGLLIVPSGVDLHVKAEALTTSSSIKVVPRNTLILNSDAPKSILTYCARTHESVLLDDAGSLGPFSNDAYFALKRARSVLCLPLSKQGKLVALLYLENNLAPRVFTSDRVAVLRFLASAAATALDNGRLYRELREREARIRRLVDANIIGIHIFNRDGSIDDANQSFLATIGYDSQDPASEHLRWTELTPPEWREATSRGLAELEATGVTQPFEKEYYRRDGSRVPVLIGAAAFDDRRDQGVAFVLDLTQRKSAEAEAREHERRYREAQIELAHANRVSALGQLTASIAHEVNQPNATVITGTQAALRWLNRNPPQLHEVRDALIDIEQNALRASEIIGRIRDLLKKAPPKKDALIVNDVVGEVVDIARTEASRNDVTVRLELAEHLPKIIGDRVELQQVVLNLMLNAMEAMRNVSRGREIVIRTGRSDSRNVFVAVNDSGPGFPAQNTERMFDPFYTTKPGGLGIGLSICRSIIEAHGGALRAHAGASAGATFMFTVPARIIV